MKLLYLDESGDHDLERIRPDFPVFVLGGIIVDRSYARDELEPEIQIFKQKWFKRQDIILHSADMVRGKNGFERLRADAQFRGDFLAALSELMRKLEYQVVACVIKKDEHVAKYGRRALDPYHLSLSVIVERFCLEIGDKLDGGLIYAERRRPDLDHELDVAWESLRIRDTYHLNQYKLGQIDERIIGLSLKAKSLNLPGLQLADLVISPIGRHVLGLSTHDNWEIVRGKMCHRNGRIEGYGLVTLPK